MAGAASALVAVTSMTPPAISGTAAATAVARIFVVRLSGRKIRTLREWAGARVLIETQQSSIMFTYVNTC
jgi:hypothetical protein